MDRWEHEPTEPDNSASQAVPGISYSRALSVPRVLRAVGPVRRWVGETVTAWGLGKAAESAEQIAGELTTNALVHTHGQPPITLLLMYAAGTVRLEVRDDDSVNLPARKNPAPTDERGRGLIIIESLADRWGTRVTGVGKSVWAELDVTPPFLATDASRPITSKEGMA